MTTQITVRLPDSLRKALKKAARRSERKVSEIVRMALGEYLEVGPRSRKRPSERVRGLIGSLASGVPDLAERHRDHVLESIRRGR